MRKFITLIAMIVLAAGLHAQNEVTKFLGIPVDGTKSEMIQKLKAKGFTYDPKSDFLEGEFNGEKVNIFIVTQGNKVYRVMVSDKKTRGEAQIRIRFNNLISQFENNPKYMPYDNNKRIEDDENISYGITVKKKQYQAVFFQCGDSIFLANYIKEKYAREIKKMHDYYNQFTEEEWENPTQEMSDTYSKLSQEYMEKVTNDIIVQRTNKQVWFTINEFQGEYYISMYYDNHYNKANGDDL